MKLVNTYGAELLDVMGSDLTVVNAARVSFDKFHEVFEEGKDDRLIDYLARHNHWSPFAHPQLSFRVKAPIFVARQLQKHQIGLAWNEVSRRYVDNEPEFYVPDIWRKRAEDKKQGSSAEIVERLYDDEYMVWLETPAEALEGLVLGSLELYNLLLTNDVAPEQARMVLPQNMITEWVWTGSLYAFSRVCNLRLKPDAQVETRRVAEDISNAMHDHFPVSTEALDRTD